MIPARKNMTGLPTVQRPSDLAALVHSYLLGGVDARHRGVTEMPALEMLEQLFDALFYLSISSEEGQQIVCSAAFMSPPSRAPRALRSRRLSVDISAGKSIRFPRALPCDTRTLRKLAQAVDPCYAALAIYPNGDQLQVWGIVDQFPLHLERFTNWESMTRSSAPGLFYARITGPGEVTVYMGDRIVAVLRQNRLISREYDALWHGPLSASLDRYIRRFQQDVRRGVGDFLYQSAGKWFEGTDEPWRCSEDFGNELRDDWLGVLCRILMRIRDYRHGGALIICPQKPTADLSIKYPFVYHGITESLEAYSAAHISEQCIETEARQGRLHLLGFEGKPIAKYGYFVTPDARENIFMQGISLLEHDVLFRSWHYLALRADARAALAGAVGLVASLSRIDGSVLLRNGLDVAGFGVEIRTKAELTRVYLAGDEHATSLVPIDPLAYGTRHRSMMRYCQAHPSATGIVVSQDGDIRAITTVESKVVMWEHLQLRAGTLNEDMFPLEIRKRITEGATVGPTDAQEK
jgi:hypothetical protein